VFHSIITHECHQSTRYRTSVCEALRRKSSNLFTWVTKAITLPLQLRGKCFGFVFWSRWISTSDGEQGITNIIWCYPFCCVEDFIKFPSLSRLTQHLFITTFQTLHVSKKPVIIRCLFLIQKLKIPGKHVKYFVRFYISCEISHNTLH
jgi:hypothetical protein